MRAFLIAIVAAIVVASGASLVLKSVQRESSAAFTTSGARVGDPGYNLVGKDG